MSEGIKNSLNPSQERTVDIITYANTPFPSQGNLVPHQQNLGTGITSSGLHALGNHHQGQCHCSQLSSPPYASYGMSGWVHSCSAWRKVLRLAQELHLPQGTPHVRDQATFSSPFVVLLDRNPHQGNYHLLLFLYVKRNILALSRTTVLFICSW